MSRNKARFYSEKLSTPRLTPKLTLYFIKLYCIIIPATCFGLIYRAIFRLIFRQVECIILVIRDDEIS